MPLDSYRTLGRSGLVVSPLALGSMTFGAQRWGTGEEGSRAVFDAYVEAGGNFIDTADVYSGGRSEEMLGGFIADRRHRLVVATKAGFSRESGYPLAGGNGAKNIRTALEGSLLRLRTDYVDLFWLHVWDQVTPAEEALQTLAGLVRAGTILYYGLSNAPAWYVAKLATLAAAHGLPAPVALQYEYSLVQRGIEAEIIPAAREFGLAVQPWSPLGGGFLTGKYARADVAPDKAGRLGGANPFGDTKFNDRNWRVLDALRAVADEAGYSPAQVALAWALVQPSTVGLLVGASRVEQLRENVSALEVRLTEQQRAVLDAASAPEPSYPAALFTQAVSRYVFGGSAVAPWRA